jgi:hypothetical protein
MSKNLGNGLVLSHEARTEIGTYVWGRGMWGDYIGQGHDSGQEISEV